MPRPRSKSGETPYIRLMDIAPLDPVEREASLARLTRLYEDINTRTAAERRARLLSWARWAP